MNTQIADTIIQQLGGAGRLKAMIGAKQFQSEDSANWVQFKIGSGAKKRTNTIRIELNGMDLYDIKLSYNSMNRKTFESKEKINGEFKDIYCDQLKSLIEQETGMYLSL